ncbi:MAG: calcium/sodium antiporter [Pseudomonadales bacterium]|nr:calcium/sodium antiporter [Pseudomonadales bacterium]
MSIFMHFGIIIASLAVLVWSADRFVFGASGFARNLGISPLIIGLTIVAMGSSAPEMMAAAQASLQNGTPDIGVGNAIGSNITNILFVIGLTALIKPIVVGSSTVKQEIPMVLIASVIGAYFLLNGELTKKEGVILLIAFFATITFLTLNALRHSRLGDDKETLKDIESEVPDKMPLYKSVLWLIVGLVFLVLSAKYLVISAKVIALHFGLSELVIGLTVIAIGTSLPELAASITAVLKGEDDLAIGNIIGSNIFNIFAVMSIPAILTPGLIQANRDTLVMIAATLLLLAVAVIGKKRSINRIEGGILFAGFISYQVFVFVSS